MLALSTSPRCCKLNRRNVYTHSIYGKRDNNMDNQTLRERLKDKKRIVVKVGSSSLTHAETGSIDLIKMEKLVRELTDLHN